MLKCTWTQTIFFVQINLCTCLKRTAPFCPVLTQILTFYRLQKLRNLAIICCTTEQVRGVGLFLGWCHRLTWIVLSLCKHACKELCDVNPGIDPYPLLARPCNWWWPDFVTFTACKKSRFGLKRSKKAQCVSNRCKDLFEWKKYFRVRCTLIESPFKYQTGRFPYPFLYLHLWNPCPFIYLKPVKGTLFGWNLPA